VGARSSDLDLINLPTLATVPKKFDLSQRTGVWHHPGGCHPKAWLAAIRTPFGGWGWCAPHPGNRPEEVS